MEGNRIYFCIDMKSFYASVECAERGYNPFETDLVVADVTRGKNALCLAITPHMKSLGIKNRCDGASTYMGKELHLQTAREQKRIRSRTRDREADRPAASRHMRCPLAA